MNKAGSGWQGWPVQATLSVICIVLHVLALPQPSGQPTSQNARVVAAALTALAPEAGLTVNVYAKGCVAPARTHGKRGRKRPAKSMAARGRAVEAHKVARRSLRAQGGALEDLQGADGKVLAQGAHATLFHSRQRSSP